MNTPKLPRRAPVLGRNVRGKKTRNPGWEAGNHWVTCDRCGCAIRAKDAKKEWTGLWVCPDDWEPRHPQDFVRGRYDEIAAQEPVRPESPDIFVDRGPREEEENEIPAGTFDNSL